MHDHEIWQVNNMHASYDVIIPDVGNTTLRDTNEDMAAGFSSEEQRIYINFESYPKRNAREIHVALQVVSGNSALSYSQVARWAIRFNRGRESAKIAGGEVGKIQQVTHI